VFLAVCTVAMANYYVTKMIHTCSSVIGHFYNTMIIESTGKKMVLMTTHKNLSLEKCWNLLPANFKKITNKATTNQRVESGDMSALTTIDLLVSLPGLISRDFERPKRIICTCKTPFSKKGVHKK